MHEQAHAIDAQFVGGTLDGKAFLSAKGYDAEVGATSRYAPRPRPLDGRVKLTQR